MVDESYSLWDRCLGERLRVYVRVAEWERSPGIKDSALYVYRDSRKTAILFGYSRLDEFKNNFTEHHAEILHKLDGPHGYAVYKAMKAKQDE